MFGIYESPEQAREAQQHALMEREDFFRSVERLFSELPIEHLVILCKIFNNMASISTTKQYVNYIYGMGVGVLQQVHHVCANCGKNHDVEMLSSNCTPTDPSGGSQ